MYFPYYYIFTSASHTLQKPQTKDNGSCSYISFFLIRKKEDYTLHFQSLSTFKKVPKNINELLTIMRKKQPKLLTNLHKKSFLFRITQSILFLFIKLKHSIKFIFVFFLYWTRWLDWTRRCMYGSLCTLTGGGVLCLFPIIDLCDHSL